MVINMEKSSLTLNRASEEFQQRIMTEIEFALSPFGEGFKYWGFFLKPNAYSFKDCLWI